MFSVVIATHDSERALVATLAALIPGATAGVIREVIVADAGSRDDTAGIADVAGCRFVVSSQPLGARLAAAARSARGAWLMFLAPGLVPEPAWIDETIRFVEGAERSGAARAAVFAARGGGLLASLRRAVGALPKSTQGLLIPKLFYDELGGHRAHVADPETDLLRRIGPRRIATLRSAALMSSAGH
jgi:glycosyltransferase involved in cell wall biosynthesis